MAERERGKTISVQTVFSKALESDELMGYIDPKSKYVWACQESHKLCYGTIIYSMGMHVPLYRPVG